MRSHRWFRARLSGLSPQSRFAGSLARKEVVIDDPVQAEDAMRQMLRG